MNALMDFNFRQFYLVYGERQFVDVSRILKGFEILGDLQIAHVHVAVIERTYLFCFGLEECENFTQESEHDSFGVEVVCECEDSNGLLINLHMAKLVVAMDRVPAGRLQQRCSFASDKIVDPFDFASHGERK